MDPLKIFEQHMDEIHALGVRGVGVFGSFARGEVTNESDVGVYVEFDDDQRTYDSRCVGFDPTREEADDRFIERDLGDKPRGDKLPRERRNLP